MATGKRDLALPLFEETLKLSKAKLAPEHPDTLAAMNSLAAAYQAAGKLVLALPLFEESLKLRKAKLGPEHPDTLISLNNLAVAYQVTGKLNQALPLYAERSQVFLRPRRSTGLKIVPLFQILTSSSVGVGSEAVMLSANLLCPPPALMPE